MRLGQIHMSDSLLHSDNLRAELQEANNIYARLGEPIYTNYLKKVEGTFAEFDHCMAIVLDVAYMTSLMIPLGVGEDGTSKEYLHCDRNRFCVSEGKMVTEVDNSFMVMEDIIDKRLKYGRMLRDVEGIDLLESISDTKEHFITKLNMLKQFGSSESAQHILSFEGNSQVEEKIFDTWINDIENM